MLLLHGAPRRAVALLVVLTCLVWVPGLWADSGTRLASIFHIAKNENRNQVHYDVRVDARCRPLREDPIVPYWREREQGEKVTSELGFFERRAYGIADKVEVEILDNGGQVRFALQPLPKRTVLVRTYLYQGRCKARAWTHIGGKFGVLESIFVQVGFLSAEYVILHGNNREGAPLKETIHPSRRHLRQLLRR